MSPRLRTALTALGIAALCGWKAPPHAPPSRTAVAGPRPVASPPPGPAPALDRLPLAFEPSANGRDAFQSRVGPGAARVTRSGVVIWPRAGDPAIDIDFGGATVAGPLEPSQRLPGYVNYLIGDDRTKWRTHVPTYARVRAADVYLGIDVEYYGIGRRLEYDFLVRPNADPSAIRLQVRGGRAERTASGALAVDGRVVQRRPTAFQSIGGVRTRVASDYVRRADGTFGIELGAYDAREPLVIDPLVETFTWHGDGIDVGNDIAVGPNGDVYVAGTSTSTNLPTTSASYQPHITPGPTNTDGIIFKLTHDRTAIEFATYFGGVGDDSLAHIAVDASGIYFDGLSRNVPGASPGCTAPASARCGFVAKLSPDGTRLMYSIVVESGAESSFHGLLGTGKFVVTPAGTVFVITTFTGGCGPSTVYAIRRVSSDGTSVKGVLYGGGGCEVNGWIPDFVAARDGTVYAMVLQPVSLDLTEARMYHLGEDGSVGPYVLIQRLTSVGLPIKLAIADGRFLLEGLSYDSSTGLAALVLWQADGNGQAQWNTTIPVPPVDPHTATLVEPLLTVDDTGFARTVVCNQDQSQCIATVVDNVGTVRASESIGPANGATLGADGFLYTVGPSAVTVRRYAQIWVAAFTANRVSPIRFNDTISFSAAAKPTAGLSFEYTFYRLNHATGTWTQIQPYGPASSFQWTPTYADIGTYTFQVWVRRVGSSAAYEAWAGQELTVGTGPLPTVTALTALQTLPGPPGRPLAWVAEASGGTGAYVYKFYRYDADGWHLVQDYSASPVYVWTPAAGDIGAHSLQVWVRNADSPASYEAALGTAFTVQTPDPLTVALGTDRPFPARAGHPLTFTAAAAGGSGPLDYRFLRLDADGWHISQDYGPDNRYVYTPGLADVGDHVLQVWVRSRGSSAAYEAWAGTGTFSVNVAPLSAPALTADVMFPVPSATPTTWTMTVDGGTPPLQYQFWVNTNGAGWDLARDYAASNAFTFTPSSPGRYAVIGFVRNAGSTAVYDQWTSSGDFDIAAGGPARIVSFTADRAFPAPAGVTTIWTARATGGGSGPLQYRFLVYSQKTNAWTVACEYDPNPTCAWTTTTADAGLFVLQVWVKSGATAGAYDDWASSGYFVIQ